MEQNEGEHYQRFYRSRGFDISSAVRVRILDRDSKPLVL